VDERAEVDFGTIYGDPPVGLTVVTYTDTSTFTGGDPEPLFDSDDELVFLAGEAGGRVEGWPEPAGTVPGSGVEVSLTDPLDASDAYVYLFVTDGAHSPSAGADDIPYSFLLDSGYYKTTYSTDAGPNPEDSEVVTSSYAVHFSDRWIRDETRVTREGATGVDVLDRHKNLFAPGNCTRSEDTFSAGEGAFIVNKTGPVRALRGYVGANSGPTTYRVHEWYENRERIFTDLRVHAISGMLDYFDYSSEAVGMTYVNNLNLSGVPIDGVPDSVTTGETGWEMATGPQGTVAIVPVVVTDIPDPSYTSYYSDDESPAVTQCTGDEHEYGASGIWFDHGIPNTDPYLGSYYNLDAYRNISYGPPNQSVDYALAFAERLANPLVAGTAPYDPSTAIVSSGSGTLSLSAVPSPASSTVTLTFSMPAAGHIRVDLYDVSGRHISTLVDEHRGAGRHDAARDVRGVASGVYFVRAQACGQVSVGRLVILH
jgi:hypothetical protein